MDTQQRYWEITASVVGGTWIETSMRDQQQSSNQKILGSCAFYYGTLLLSQIDHKSKDERKRHY